MNEQPVDPIPSWYVRVGVVAGAPVIGTGLAAVGLAIIGELRTAPVLVLSALCSIAVAWLAWPRGPREIVPRPRVDHWCAAGAVVIAVSSFVANGLHASDHVIVDRDPGAYAVTARWLSDHGGLSVPARIGPFGVEDDAVTFASAAVYETDDGRLEFQFNHLFPSLVAVATLTGGDVAREWTPAALAAVGLLMVYAVAARFAGRPVFAVAVVAAFAVSLPYVFVARDLYSETAMLLLLWGALWWWIRAAESLDPRLAAATGLAFGAVLATRIDGVAYLVPVPIALALVLRREGTRPSGRWVIALLAGLVPGAALAIIDLAVRSGTYLSSLRTEVLSLVTALAVSIAVAVVVLVVGNRARPTVEARSRASWPVVVGLAAFALVVGAWLARPYLQEVHRGPSIGYVESLQAAEGLSADGSRTYDEDSLRRLGWYLGAPALVGAAAGAALVAARAVRRPGAALVLPTLVLATGTALYVWRMSVYPDQMWATRRFVPAAIPFLLVLAGVAASALAGLVATRASRPMNGVVVALLVGALVVPPAVRSWPVRSFEIQSGFSALPQTVCEQIGPDAAVLVLNDGAALGASVPQTIRSFCDVPVALSVYEGLDERLPRLAAGWAAEGVELWVIGKDSELLHTVLPGAEVLEIGPVENPDGLERRLGEPVNRYDTERFGFALARVP